MASNTDTLSHHRPIAAHEPALAEFGFWRGIGALLIALTLTACDSGHAAANREAGFRLARQWCSGCHSVDQSQTGTDAAPSFQSIAQSQTEDDAWLKAWLAAPHPAMPDLNLSRAEIDDIVAYLSSLAKP